MLIYGIIGWFLGAFITGILVEKVEKDDPPTKWNDSGIMMLAMLWPLVLIILMCKVYVMYIKYIKSRKERAKNLKQEKRDEVESILKEI